MLKSNIPNLSSLKLNKDDKYYKSSSSSSNKLTNLNNNNKNNYNVTMANFSNKDDNYYYHGGASLAVPFIWESQPGTPKIKFKENYPLPPLTPPPSYFYSISPKSTTPTHKPPSKPSHGNNLLDTFFTKRGSRRMSFSISPASSSSSLSSSSYCYSSSRLSSYSTPSSPMTNASRSQGRYGISRPRQSFDLTRMVDEDDDDDECETHGASILCFGSVGRGRNSRSRGCYASIVKVLLH